MNRDEAMKAFASALEEAVKVLREEPEIVSMEKCEDSVRFCKWGADAKYHTAAANYLSVLRHNIVPWLREVNAQEMLRKLGESP